MPEDNVEEMLGKRVTYYVAVGTSASTCSCLQCKCPWMMLSTILWASNTTLIKLSRNPTIFPHHRKVDFFSPSFLYFWKGEWTLLHREHQHRRPTEGQAPDWQAYSADLWLHLSNLFCTHTCKHMPLCSPLEGISKGKPFTSHFLL